MTKIPPPPPRKAKDIKAIALEWNNLKAQIKSLQDKELALRKFLFAQVFPTPKEGMNRLVKPGLEASGKQAIYRKVDKAAFSTMAAELRKKGINLDVLIEMKPELVLSAYRALDERKRRLFESVLTITDASPTLDINLGK